MNRLQEQLKIKSHSTLSKWRNFKAVVPPDKAAMLERITGIDRRKFCWPDEFGNPWPDVKAMFKKHKNKRAA